MSDLAYLVDFFDYIQAQMRIRGWSQDAFATKAEISRSSVQRLLGVDTLGRDPSFEVIVSAAHALGVSDIDLLRRAGLLDPAPLPVMNEDELIRIFRRLPQTDKDQLLNFARYLLSGLSHT
jgi:transcriptional regulator with XRE-family HTH domain